MREENENLIIGYLNNRLGKSDTEKFFSWIEEDEENKKFFFEIKTIYEMSPSQIDIEKSWQRLLNKREEMLLNNKHSRVGIFRGRLWEYAAIATIAILISSSFFLYYLLRDEWYMGEQDVCYISGTEKLADILELPDGTHVKLGASSTLKYSNHYGRTNRDVYLDGEAFFDVAKMKDKPFVVNLRGQSITALGTQFNVLAYSVDSIIKTTLVEGSIKLKTGMHMENFLLPNQQLIYNRSNNSINIIDIPNTEEVTSWISGYYSFTEEPLGNILLRMGKVLDVRFVITSEQLRKTKFNGKFYSGQDVQDIMEIIKMSIPIYYKIKGDTITITELKS